MKLAFGAEEIPRVLERDRERGREITIKRCMIAF